jgi:hypothetical protein
MARVSNRSVSGLSIKASALVLAVAAATQVMAADNGLQRYSPGVGGSDMTSPLVPGWYVQMPMVAYHASKIKGGDGKQAVGHAVATPAEGNAQQAGLFALAGYANGVPVSYNANIKTDTYALLPRLTYLDSKQVLGANVGFTVMLPLVKRKATLTASNITLAPDFATRLATSQGAQTANLTVAGVQQKVGDRVAGTSGSEVGIGDVEVSPLMHWEIGDHQAVTFAPTVVLPTGDYNAAQRVNPGYGNFITFRPSVQYAFIGDGWDVGARAVLSFNTRNKDNGYYSGNMFNLDYQLMKFVSEDVRVGLQGYFVRQLSKDTQDLGGFSAAQQAALAKEIVNGNKASVNAAGPAVGWLRNGGEFLLEGKFLKEFDARNRTEGQAFWLTVSKPL